MRRLFYGNTVGGLGSLGLLLLRLVMGAAFVLHGWPKIQNPLDWMGAVRMAIEPETKDTRESGNTKKSLQFSLC